MKIWTVLGFVLLATALVTPALGQMTAEAWYNKGLVLYYQAKYDGAIQAFSIGP